MRLEGFGWFVNDGDNQQGPMSATAVAQLAKSKGLSPTHFIWKEGMDDWVQAGAVPGLFDSPPPPLPQAKAPVTAGEPVPVASLARISSVLKPIEAGLQAQPTDIGSASKKGLKGWLRVIAALIILTEIGGIFALISFFDKAQPTDAETALIAAFPPAINILLTSIMSIIFPALLLYLFYLKKRIFPNIFIAWCGVSSAICTANTIAIISHTQDSGVVLVIIVTYVLTIAWLCLLIFYILKSKRVANTFIQ
jgi:GYF domain 2/Protein of unknown function (DUF2569)